MHTDMSILGVRWMPLRMKLTGAFPMDFGECGFTRTACWVDSILTALNKMKQTDHNQQSNRLLQEFYAMTQKHNEPIGKYAVTLDMVASKVWI